MRDEQARGDLLDRARLFPSGPNLVGATAAEAREGVDQIAELGVDVIKTRLDDRPDDMAPAVYRALIDQAHRRGLLVAAHAVTLEDAKGLAEAGVDAIVHSVRDRDVDAELIAALTSRDVGYVPTLTRTLSLFLYETTPAFFERPVLPARRRRLPGGDGADPGPGAPGAGARAANRPRRRGRCWRRPNATLKLLADGGVTIAMGTDSGTQLGTLAGVLRARGAGVDGRGRPDAAAGARGGNGQRPRGSWGSASWARWSPATTPTSSCWTPIRWPTSATRGESTPSGSPAAGYDESLRASHSFWSRM